MQDSCAFPQFLQILIGQAAGTSAAMYLPRVLLKPHVLNCATSHRYGVKPPQNLLESSGVSVVFRLNGVLDLMRNVNWCSEARWRPLERMWVYCRRLAHYDFVSTPYALCYKHAPSYHQENPDVQYICRSHPAQPLLNSLHWLPIQQRIIFKLLLFVYKSLNNKAPSYISDCLTVYTPNRNLRSSSDNFQPEYPLTRTQAGDRTFTVAASKEWNNLPLYIRNSVSVNTFQKALKTHLFP